jgi:hypothetical protein
VNLHLHALGNLPGKICVLVFILCASAQFTIGQTQSKPRIIITADPELDDNNSLIRLLLYSSDLQVEGLIYASSGFHWKGDGKGTKWSVPNREYNRFGQDLCPCISWRWAKDERFIHDAVEAYEKAYPNLKIHNQDYPSPAFLKANIRYGNIELDGEISKNTPGSDLIRELILDDKPGQLFITAWGGQSTIARALKSIEEQYQFSIQWESIRKKISRKVVLLPSGDQDDTYATYIKPHWPEIEYRQFRKGPNYGYGAQLRATKEDSVFLTSDWMTSHIWKKGPLGSLYRVWGDGKQMVKDDKFDYFGLSGFTDEQLKQQGYVVWMPVQEKGSWLGEGDNHTFMNMLGNGLRAFESGFFGGWGGRSEPQMQEFSFAPADSSVQGMVNALSVASGTTTGYGYPNFFAAAQRDFASRMKWSTTPTYAKANHEPIVKVDGPLEVIVYAGQSLKLSGSLSDPDGNIVFIKWWQFMLPDTQSTVDISSPTALQTMIQIPKEARPGAAYHIILEATDDGSPALTRYQRIVLTVKGR